MSSKGVCHRHNRKHAQRNLARSQAKSQGVSYIESLAQIKQGIRADH